MHEDCHRIFGSNIKMNRKRAKHQFLSPRRKHQHAGVNAKGKERMRKKQKNSKKTKREEELSKGRAGGKEKMWATSIVTLVFAVDRFLKKTGGNKRWGERVKKKKKKRTRNRNSPDGDRLCVYVCVEDHPANREKNCKGKRALQMEILKRQ